MRFPGIRLVEQMEQNFRRVRVCAKKRKKKKRVTVTVNKPGPEQVGAISKAQK